jgi:hypothetical protein
MLKITGHTTPGVATVEVDEYVPLSFRALPSPRPAPVTWRTGDLQTNMFEVKIDADSRELFAATLVTFDGHLADVDARLFLEAETVPGLPLTDASGSPASLLNEPGQLTLSRSDDQVVLHFGDITTPTTILAADRARFLVRGEYLVGVGFSDLTPVELQIILASTAANLSTPAARKPSGA